MGTHMLDRLNFSAYFFNFEIENHFQNFRSDSVLRGGNCILGWRIIWNWRVRSHQVFLPYSPPDAF